MANTKTTKKASTAKKVADKTDAVNKAVEEAAAPPAKKKRMQADPNEIITVYNGFQGRLVYVSARTKETFRWNEFGDTQGIELRELVNAKRADRSTMVKGMDVVYIYHDTIDEASHTADSMVFRGRPSPSLPMMRARRSCFCSLASSMAMLSLRRAIAIVWKP